MNEGRKGEWMECRTPNKHATQVLSCESNNKETEAG